jgi:hypothetical protein
MLSVSLVLTFSRRSRRRVYDSGLARKTHKSSSSFDVAWIEVSFSTGGGTFDPAGADPPSLAYAIAPVPNIVPSALGCQSLWIPYRG